MDLMTMRILGAVAIAIADVFVVVVGL